MPIYDVAVTHEIGVTYAVEVEATFIEGKDNPLDVQGERVDKKTLVFPEESQAVGAYSSLVAGWMKDEVDGRLDHDWSELVINLIKIYHYYGGDSSESCIGSQSFPLQGTETKRVF